jgi:hypothetical protein
MVKITVEDSGEPSYTSGYKKWKGAQPILYNKKIVIKVTPVINNIFKLKFKSNTVNKKILLKLKEPKQPYIKLEPNKKIPDINELPIKYFKPASEEKTEFLLKDANK